MTKEQKAAFESRDLLEPNIKRWVNDVMAAAFDTWNTGGPADLYGANLSGDDRAAQLEAELIIWANATLRNREGR